MWGVGCIFVEMVTGMPTFPGIRDTYDQLDKIFKLLGTPTEETWTSVTQFPGYKPHKLGEWRVDGVSVCNASDSAWWKEKERRIKTTNTISHTNYLVVHSAGFYRPRKLGHSFPRLYDIEHGEAIANAFLQLNPDKRMGADEALRHPYFSTLPKKLYELPDGELFLF